jgi:hypothetical protein
MAHGMHAVCPPAGPPHGRPGIEKVHCRLLRAAARPLQLSPPPCTCVAHAARHTLPDPCFSVPDSHTVHACPMQHAVLSLTPASPSPFPDQLGPAGHAPVHTSWTDRRTHAVLAHLCARSTHTCTELSSFISRALRFMRSSLRSSMYLQPPAQACLLCQKPPFYGMHKSLYTATTSPFFRHGMLMQAVV